MWSNELVPDINKTPERTHASGRQMDAEFLLVAMERVTTLFDRYSMFEISLKFYLYL